ncbi:hypothetical protein [Wolbachia endosymbiont of Folsomia candida]|uniref:hypothetical protein n=1 Tax=Wolbachia endosymbiont of Folsomia candida TaxID=169402 RepID=UPI000AFAB21A|nr:hypothetical protein [Wolbachia endosymbiont of Folsomia candida]APR97781.1 hypothetical protein ASM33_00265 [Wolbachia endosymbiont of Folsomia candida]
MVEARVISKKASEFGQKPTKPRESSHRATKPDTENSSAQVFTMFNDDAKAKYIEGLKKTYLGVLLSTELNSNTSQIKDVKDQIEAFIKGKESVDEINGEITIGEIKVNVTLTRKGDDVYSVKLNENSNENSTEIAIQNTGEYTTADLLTICGQHELTMSKDQNGNNGFSVTIKGIDDGKNTTIGGPGKISIFTQHLSYIKETIDHLDKTENSNPTKEFALATGTGKTFIELILEYLPARLIGTRYLSIAPNESLIKQKRDDWKLFLSDGDINDVELNTISDEKGCSILTTQGLINNWNQFLKAIGLEELPGIIDALKIGDKKFEIKNGKINVDGKDFVILADKIQFGDEAYEINKDGKVKINNQEFTLDVKKSVFATFDEEHRIVFEELYKGCMGLVSILCKTLFLSATPSQKTYDSVKECGGLLKTLSLMEKMKSSAFGNLALNVYGTEEGNHVYSHTETLAKSVTFKTKKLKNGEDGKDDPFYYPPKTNLNGEALTGKELREEIETYIFNNVESAIGKSALFSTEIRELKDKLKEEVTYDIFTGKSTSGNHSSIVEEKRSKIIAHLIATYGQHNKAVIEKVVDDNLDYKSKIHDYSAFRVMHRLIDNTLCCLTGLSIIELNKARFPNPGTLAKKVREALESKNYNLYQYVKGVESDALRNEIVEQMQSVIDILNENKDKDLFTRLVRNWNQDKKLHTLMPLNNVPDDENKILELFQLKKNTSIFQDLKNTYEIKDANNTDGNITAIEKECNQLYKELKKEEQERNKYYDKHIKSFASELEKMIKNKPSGYFWMDDKLHYACGSEVDNSKLEDLETKLCNLKKQINDKESTSEYVQLKQAVKTAEDKLVTNFQKIKHEFSDETKYPLAQLRTFSDKNRYGKGNSKDDDAFVRMGLYGNCVDEDYHIGQVKDRQTRIHGFSAVGLDHVVVFVDKNSKFIDDPRQSIQSIRNRCFDRTHTSHYFCYSSVPLKFSPELMLKEEYITDFNKAMEEFNKRSPEELGNEILEVIDKLIQAEVSGKIKKNEKFAEIDDLAVKVIENVISSFEIVYNNKHHNAKEAQDYFAKVLEHVTSSVEKQLKKEGVAVGNLSIEHNIRGIQSEIDRIERRIRGEGGIVDENRISSEDRAVMNHIKSKMNKFTDKIDQNSKDQEETDKKLEVEGWFIWRLFVKFVRSIIRLIFKTKLEREKIKLVEEAKVLNQEKEKVEQEKLEFEVEIGIKGEKEVAPGTLARQKKKQEEQKKKLETEKVKLETELETKMNSQKNQKFIGVMKKEENVKAEEIDPEVKEKIIEKQKVYNAKLLAEKTQELKTIDEGEDKKNLDDLQALKRKIKGFEELKVKIDGCIDNASASKSPASISHSAPTPAETLKAGIDALNKPEPEETKIRIGVIVNGLNTNVKTLEDTIKNNQIKTANGQTLLKTIKGDLEALQAEKTRLEELEKKKAKLKKEKDELEKVSPDKEGSTEHKKYYDNIVNEVLVYKSITKNYDLAKAAWIDIVAPKFIQVMEKDYYEKLKNSNYSDYEKHMNSCVKSPIFPELFSNIVMPLYNHKVDDDGNMLLKILNILYPGTNNEPRVEQILGVYNTLVKKEEHNLTDVVEVMIYTKAIREIVAEVMRSHYRDEKCDFFKGIANDNLPELDQPSKKVSRESAGLTLQSNASIIKAESEIEKLENEQELTARSEILECVVTPIKEILSRSASTKRLVESGPSQQEKVVLVSSKVGAMLQGVKPSTIGDIVSPGIEFSNSIQKVLPIRKLSTIVNDMVAEQWRGEGLCISCC